jgi:hypothetical protein
LLAPRPCDRHIEPMSEDHPFTITVERNIDIVNRFRWLIYEDGKLRERSSSRSHATKREALMDAEKVLKKLVARWQTGKLPKPKASAIPEHP